MDRQAGFESSIGRTQRHTDTHTRRAKGLFSCGSVGARATPGRAPESLRELQPCYRSFAVSGCLTMCLLGVNDASRGFSSSICGSRVPTILGIIRYLISQRARIKVCHLKPWKEASQPRASPKYLWTTSMQAASIPSAFRNPLSKSGLSLPGPDHPASET